MEEKRSHEIAIKWLKDIADDKRLGLSRWYNCYDNEQLYLAVEDEIILKGRLFNQISSNIQTLDKGSSAGNTNELLNNEYNLMHAFKWRV